MSDPKRPMPGSGEPERWALPPLTLNDRCDWSNCGAPATHRVILTTGDLYGCTHHYTEHRDKLAVVAVYVQDEQTATIPEGELEDLGRMHMRRGLTHADPCRWCTLRLVNRRIFDKTHFVYREYFLCEICDKSAADMESLKGLTLE